MRRRSIEDMPKPDIITRVSAYRSFAITHGLWCDLSDSASFHALSAMEACSSGPSTRTKGHGERLADD